MANKETKKHINMSIEATSPFDGNVIVKSARSAMVVSEDQLQEWINDMTSLVNSYIKFSKHGATGVSMKDGKLQLTGSPEELMEIMQKKQAAEAEENIRTIGKNLDAAAKTADAKKKLVNSGPPPDTKKKK